VNHTDQGQYKVRVNTALVGLLGLIAHKIRQKKQERALQPPFDVYRLQKFIHESLAKQIDLGDLARQVNLSVPHFVRSFKRIFEVSPMQYIIQKRMTLACSLLVETSSPLKRVGLSVGYEDPYYFSRLFKKVMGVSPSVYRESGSSRLSSAKMVRRLQ
jgi:AraC-like DNA-binding protein